MSQEQVIESPILKAYIVEAKDLAKSHCNEIDLLSQLTETVKTGANALYRNKIKMGEELTKMDAVEKFLGKIGLGKRGVYFHLNPSIAKKAREYVLEHCKDI